MPPPTARIAFVTNVRDEPVFLPLWVAHYARIVPRAHLFVIVDGLDDVLPSAVTGVQIVRMPRGERRPGWEDERWRMITAFVNALRERFDVVVMNDVDEFIVLDPQFGTDLAAALLEAREFGVISPFAVDVIHRPDLEPDALRTDRPILQQRRHVRVHSAYCKPCIIARPVRLGPGGHQSDFPTLHLSRKLFLFHLRAMDCDMMYARQAKRREMVTTPDGRLVDGIAGAGWNLGKAEVDAYLAKFAERREPEIGDFSFDWQRARIEAVWRQDRATGLWEHGMIRNWRPYVIPDRIAGLL